VGTFERKQQHIFGVKLCAKHLQNFQILMAVDCHTRNTYVHTSYFTDPLSELSRTEYEDGQYNTTQYKNLIAQYNLVIVQQLYRVCKMCIITNYCA
jgi:hypothetical protein